MAQIIHSINVTVNGGCYHEDVAADIEHHGYALKLPESASFVLLGRNTFDLFAGFWPGAATNHDLPSHVTELARELRGKRKYVLSARELTADPALCFCVMQSRPDNSLESTRRPTPPITGSAIRTDTNEDRRHTAALRVESAQQQARRLQGGGDGRFESGCREFRAADGPHGRTESSPDAIQTSLRLTLPRMSGSRQRTALQRRRGGL